MKAKWLRVTLLVAVVAACGEGHAIFSIDVYSFMTGTGSDTLRVPPDPLPGLPPASPPVQDSIIPIGVDLPSAMSSSIVDTVLVNGSLDVTHSTGTGDRKSTRLNSSHANISYAVFCLKKKKKKKNNN